MKYDAVRLGFTGTQAGMTEAQVKAVQQIVADLHPAICHHGDCIGADAQFHTICRAQDIPIVIHPPSDPRKRAFCRDAAVVLPVNDYLIRNHDIVDSTHVLLSTPAGPEKLRSGTWSTVRYARKLGRRVIIVMPNGEVQG